MHAGSRLRRTLSGFAALALALALSAGCRKTWLRDTEIEPLPAALLPGPPATVERVDPAQGMAGPPIAALPPVGAPAQQAIAPPPPQQTLPPAPDPRASAAGLPVPEAPPAAADPRADGPPAATPALDRAQERIEELRAINRKALGEAEPAAPAAVPQPAAVAALAAKPGAAAEPQAHATPPAPADILAAPADPARPPVAAQPLNPESAVKPAPPRDVWGESLRQLREIARDRAGEPGESADLWPIRSRVLDWVAEPDGHDAEATLWTTVLRALTASSRREATDDQALGAAVQAAVEALEDRTPLAITDVQLCRKISGFGQLEPLEREPCRPGQALFIYCEIAGLRYEPVEEGFRSRQAWQVEVVSAGGGRPAWKLALPPAEDVWRRRRRDVYVSLKVTLPKTLAPGTYEIRLTQNDLVGGRAASRSVPLTIGPPRSD